MAVGVRRMTYSVEEAADIVGVSKSKIYDSIRNGELRSVQLGRRVVIPCDEIERLVGPVARPEEETPFTPAGPIPRQKPLAASEGAQMNAVHLTGTIARNPELRISRTGLEICTLQLAVPRRRRDGEDRGALPVEVVAFGPLASTASTVPNATVVAISGRLSQREWTSGDGAQHARFEVVAEDIELLRDFDKSAAG